MVASDDIPDQRKPYNMMPDQSLLWQSKVKKVRFFRRYSRLCHGLVREAEVPRGVEQVRTYDNDVLPWAILDGIRLSID